MKRATLIDSIDSLKQCDLANIVEAIDKLRSLADDFCDHYEGKFNSIRDSLGEDGYNLSDEAFVDAKTAAESLY